MPTARITKRVVDGLRPTNVQLFVWDDEVRGFGVKASPTGTVTYLYQYRMGGREAKTQRWTIGRHGVWTPDAARTEARRLAQLVDAGRDPAADERERRRQRIDLAVPAYFDLFTDNYLKREWPSSWELGAGLLKREALPVLRSKALTEVTRSDIAIVLYRLDDRPAARRNLFATLRRMFKWAVNRGDLPSSPISDMQAPAAPGSRDRVLNDHELKRVWVASEKLGYPFAPMFRLLMATGQRRDEVAGISWSELDRRERLWTLPGSRTKTGVSTQVFLNDLALAVLDKLSGVTDSDIKRWPRNGVILSGNGANPVSGFSRAKRRLDKCLTDQRDPTDDIDAIPAWRVHDLRRTVATGLQRLGVRFEVTEAVLNHSGRARSGVAGVYQRHDWKDEKRAALEAWGGHLSQVIAREDAGGSVTSPLRPSA